MSRVCNRLPRASRATVFCVAKLPSFPAKSYIQSFRGNHENPSQRPGQWTGPVRHCCRLAGSRCRVCAGGATDSGRKRCNRSGPAGNRGDRIAPAPHDGLRDRQPYRIARLATPAAVPAPPTSPTSSPACPRWLARRRRATTRAIAPASARPVSTCSTCAIWVSIGTLVLVDGRRHVSGLEGSQAVDINTIPEDLIDRIDVLTGGASAVYGADGVTGVVNFVLKKNFEGITARAQAGISKYGDAGNRLIGITAGHNFAGGRGNISIAYEYGGEDRLNSRQRPELSGTDAVSFVRNPNYVAGQPGSYSRIPMKDVRYQWTARGGAVDVDFDGVPDFNGDGRPYNLGTAIPGGYSVGSDDTLVSDYRNDLRPSTNRHVVNLLGHFDVSDKLQLFGEVKYANVKAYSLAQPTFDYYLFVPEDNPYIPAGDQVGDRSGKRRRARHARQFRPWPARRKHQARNLADRGRRAGRSERKPALRSQLCLRADQRYQPLRQRSVHRPVHGRDRCRGRRHRQDHLPGQSRSYGGAGHHVQARRMRTVQPVRRRQVLAGRAGFHPRQYHRAFAHHAACGERLRQWRYAQLLLASGRPGRLRAGRRIPQGKLALRPRSAGSAGPDVLERAEPQPRIVRREGRLRGNRCSGVQGPALLPDARFQRGGAPVGLFVDRAWKFDGNWAPVRDIRFRGTISQAVRAPNISELYGASSQTFAFFDDPCIRRQPFGGHVKPRGQLPGYPVASRADAGADRRVR